MSSKIEETTFKLFLTSGITLTIKNSDEIVDGDFDKLLKYINNQIEAKEKIEFQVILKNKYDEDKIQEVKHSYHIPYERISWYMIEEV